MSDDKVDKAPAEGSKSEWTPPSSTWATRATIGSKIICRGGHSMPAFGLGTWLAAAGDCQTAVQHALSLNYDLIDTAQMYKNEEEVGAGLLASLRPRESIFVLTKLDSDSHTPEKVEESLRLSLKKLGLKHVDLFLIHTPRGGNVVETWKAMLSMKAKGLATMVGVSNFGVNHLRELEALGMDMPEVNQVEFHPWLQQRPMLEYCKSKNIVVMGYCPLARCKCFGRATGLADIAQRHGKTEAQAAIRWSVQMGVVTIPKSTNKHRLRQNAEVFDFEFTVEEMASIASFDEGFKASNSVNSQDEPWDTVK